jgi:hypothetical protein
VTEGRDSKKQGRERGEILRGDIEGREFRRERHMAFRMINGGKETVGMRWEERQRRRDIGEK